MTSSSVFSARSYSKLAEIQCNLLLLHSTVWLTSNYRTTLSLVPSMSSITTIVKYCHVLQLLSSIVIVKLEGRILRKLISNSGTTK